MKTNFFHPSLLLLFLDRGYRMGKDQDLGSGINISDPQHWFQILIFFYPGSRNQQEQNRGGKKYFFLLFCSPILQN